MLTTKKINKTMKEKKMKQKDNAINIKNEQTQVASKLKSLASWDPFKKKETNIVGSTFNKSCNALYFLFSMKQCKPWDDK